MSKTINYKIIYKLNNFTIGGYSFTIDTLKHTPLINKTFAILTAYNPNNMQLTIEENIQKNRQLYDDIYADKYLFEEALGFLDEHQEESYCIYDISFERAIELAKKYNQYSIFYHSKEKSGYYEVDTMRFII